ncbi:Beta-1,3-galactosyltransferase 1 [Colletotrichum orbiculare MAFF 240422]|uniref:Hexosyltransferase n=1 Tax=Colletotrichum orbiculare (strain 104-T / ATCC 96160 / CBS 514.97 / LARS 414 / MAFF 240422) TaxID=1213857 RepID=A0A484G5N6_COLOR|nr:Beta-1,3-galactosyltransferase 1 [Colletotrichum orbiculare MAFF 240422]
MRVSQGCGGDDKRSESKGTCAAGTAKPHGHSPPTPTCAESATPRPEEEEERGGELCLWSVRRFFALSIILFFAVFQFLRHDTPRVHHQPFEAPETQIIVHGDVVEGLPKLAYDLRTFPYSPQETPADGNTSKQRAPWLAAVISTAWDVERRMLIRSTWMQLYKDVPFDGRFVVANPGPYWTDIVARENRTFGDLIVLDRIQEDDVTANTIKTLEFFKWLLENNVSYEFVSKMDTDVWLNARGFWDRFLEPRLVRNNSYERLSSSVERTVIGELYYSPYWDLVFPQGAMYTVTWDVVELLSSLQQRFHVVTGEDMAVAVLLLQGHERVNFINFRGTEKFDYNDKDARNDGSAWARESTHPNAVDHAIVGTDAIVVHRLKDEVEWIKVADCFDESGIKTVPAPSRFKAQKYTSLLWHDFWYRLGFSTRYDSRFERIPEFMWTLEDGGSWVCDGIWDLGKTRMGSMT